MSKEVTTKILTPHSPDCYALKNAHYGVWSTPWSYIDSEKREYRDALGRLLPFGSGSRWLRIRCNCTHCPAEIAVNEGWLLEMLPEGSFALRRIASQEK